MTSPDLSSVADAKYVNLTTFRRPVDGSDRGVGVSTPVWIGETDGRLLVMTQGATGKVKRIRHTPQIELQACTQRGKPLDGAPIVEGSARIRTDAAAFQERDEVFTKKYGLLFRIFRWMGRRRAADSVILEITLPD